MDYARLKQLVRGGDVDACEPLLQEAARRGDFHGKLLAAALMQPSEEAWWEVRELIETACPGDSRDTDVIAAIEDVAPLFDARWTGFERVIEVFESGAYAALARTLCFTTEHIDYALTRLEQTPWKAHIDALKIRHTFLAGRPGFNPPVVPEPFWELDVQWRGLCLQGRLAEMRVLQAPCFQKLQRLDLQGQTSIDDDAVDVLCALKDLEWLNLAGTRVGHAGVAKLLKNPNLRYLDVRDTHVEPALARALLERAFFSTLGLDEAIAWSLEQLEAEEGGIEAVAGLFALRADVAHAPVAHKHLWSSLRTPLLAPLYEDRALPSSHEAMLEHLPVASDALCEIVAAEARSEGSRASSAKILGVLRPARGPRVLAAALNSGQPWLVENARHALEAYEDAPPLGLADGVRIVPCSQTWDVMREEDGDNGMRFCEKCATPVVRVRELSALRAVAGDTCAYFDPAMDPSAPGLAIHVGLHFQEMAPGTSLVLGSAADADFQDLRLAPHHVRLTHLGGGRLQLQSLGGFMRRDGVVIRETQLNRSEIGMVELGDASVQVLAQPDQSLIGVLGFMDARVPGLDPAAAHLPAPGAPIELMSPMMQRPMPPGPIDGNWPVNPGLVMPPPPGAMMEPGPFPPPEPAPPDAEEEPQATGVWARLKRFFSR